MDRLFAALLSLSLFVPGALSQGVPAPARVFPFDDDAATSSVVTTPTVELDPSDEPDAITDDVETPEIETPEIENTDDVETTDNVETPEIETTAVAASRASLARASGTGTTFLINDAQFAVDINPGDGICSTGALSYDGVTPACNMRAALMETNALGAIVAANGTLPTDAAANPIAPPYTISVDSNWVANVASSSSNISFPSNATGCTNITNPTPAVFAVTQNGTTNYNYFDATNGWQIGTVANNVTVTLPNFGYCSTWGGSATSSSLANLMYNTSLGDTMGAYFYISAPVTINLNYQLTWNSGTGTQTQNHPDIFYIDSPNVTLTGLKDIYAQISTITVSPNTSNLLINNADVQPPATTTRFLTLNGGAGTDGALKFTNAYLGGVTNPYAGGFRGVSTANTYGNGGAVLLKNSGINGNNIVGDLEITNCNFNGVLPFNGTNGTAVQHVGNVDFTNNIVTNIGAQAYSGVMRFDYATVDGAINATNNQFTLSNVTNGGKLFVFDSGAISSGATVNISNNIYNGCSSTCTAAATAYFSFVSANSVPLSGVMVIDGNNGGGGPVAMAVPTARSRFVLAPLLSDGGYLNISNNLVTATNTDSAFIYGAGNLTANNSTFTANGNAFVASGTFSGSAGNTSFFTGYTALAGTLTFSGNTYTAASSDTTLTNNGYFIYGPIANAATSAVIALDGNTINTPGWVFNLGPANAPTTGAYAALTGSITLTNNQINQNDGTTSSAYPGANFTTKGAGVLQFTGQITGPIALGTGPLSASTANNSNGARGNGNVINTAGQVANLSNTQAATAQVSLVGNVVNASASVLKLAGANQGGVIIQGNPVIVTNSWVAQVTNTNSTGPVVISDNPSVTATTSGTAANSTLFSFAGTVPAGTPGYVITNNNITNTFGTAPATSATIGIGSLITITSSQAAGSTITIDHNVLSTTGGGGAIILSGAQGDGTAATVIDSNVITSAGTIISFGAPNAVNKYGATTISNNNITATGSVPNHRFHLNAGVTADTTTINLVNNYFTNTSAPLIHAIVALPISNDNLMGITNIKYNTFVGLNGSFPTNSGHWIFFSTSNVITAGQGNNSGIISGQLQISNNYVQYNGTTSGAIAWTGKTASIVNSQNLYIQNNYIDWTSTATYGIMEFTTVGLKNISGNIFTSNVVNSYDTVAEEKRASTNQFGLLLHAAATAGAMATWYPSARTANPTNNAPNQDPSPIKAITGAAAKPADIVAVPTPGGIMVAGPTPGNAAISGPTPATPATVQTNPVDPAACVIELAVAAPTTWTNARYPGNTTPTAVSVAPNNPVYVDVYWTSGTLATTGNVAGAANDAELFLGRYPVYGTAQTLAVALPEADDPRLSPVFGAGAQGDASQAQDGSLLVPQSVTVTANSDGSLNIPSTTSVNWVTASSGGGASTIIAAVDGSAITAGTVLPVGQITPTPAGKLGPTTGPIDPDTNQVSGALRVQTVDPTAPILAASQYSRSVQIGGDCSATLSVAQANGNYTWDEIGSTDPTLTGVPVTQADPTMVRNLHFTVTATMPVDPSTVTLSMLSLSVTAPASNLNLPAPTVDWADPSVQAEILAGAQAAPARFIPNPDTGLMVTPVPGGRYYDVIVQLDDTGTATLTLNAPNLTPVTATTPAPDNVVTYVNPLQLSTLSSAVPGVKNDVLITGSPDGQQYNLSLTTTVNQNSVPTCPSPAAATSSLCLPLPMHDVAATPTVSGVDTASGTTPTLSPAVPIATLATGATTGSPAAFTAVGVNTPVTPGTVLTLTNSVTSDDANYAGLVLPTRTIPLFSTVPVIDLEVQTYIVDKPYATIAEVIACGNDEDCGEDISGSTEEEPAIASVYDWVCAVAQVANASTTDEWNSSVNKVQVTPKNTWGPVPNNPFPDPTASPVGLGWNHTVPSIYSSTSFASPTTTITETTANAGSTTVGTPTQPYLFCTQLTPNTMPDDAQPGDTQPGG